MPSVLDIPEIRRHVLPISVAQYHGFSEHGLIPEKTELIEGVILRKMTKGPAHSYVVARLQKLLLPLLPSGNYLRKEEPLTLTDSEPEPDLAIVAGNETVYKDEHPHGALLVIEVSSSTLAEDRAKAGMYARAAIPEYWIINLPGRLVERFSEPQGSRYNRLETTNDQARVPLFNGSINSADFFP